MSWYSKYLSVFEKPYDSNSANNAIIKIKENLKKIDSRDPIVSVVVIAYNEEERLLSCLWSLSENIFNGSFEIIGINNNSTDKTAEIFEKTGIRYFNENKKGPGHARQCGLDNARGKYYFCIDADTMYPPYYIQTLYNVLQENNVLGVCSLYNYIPDENHSWLGLKFYILLRDIHIKLQSIKRPEMSVRGAVFAFNIEYGRKVGFRTDIKRGEDGSLGFGLKKYGKLKFILNSKARAITSARTINTDGSFFNSFKIRFLKYLKNSSSYFHKKDIYKDEESNLIK